MGGLVVMAAVGSHELHPNWIDRIVHIGAPLQGAPAAMQAAFDPNQWPFLPDLFEVVWKPGMSRYRLIQAMQKAAQSFESAYELMPPSAVVYAYQDLGTPLFNPLYHPETRFTKKQIALAMAFEQLLREADERLHACPRPLCCIYSDGLDTCVRLQIGYEASSYRVTPEIAPKGDGTVPSYSAMKPYSASGRCSHESRRVQDVAHAWLCNHKDVLAQVKAAL
jgi:hypothetical protein